MNHLFSLINNLDYAQTGEPLKPEDITTAQAELASCDIPQIPDDVIAFLKVYNGFLLEGRCIWGINNSQHFLYDILSENLNVTFEEQSDILLLGSTETTFIGWSQPQKRYSMIDKSSFMVLHNFRNFIEAVKYVLKIDD